MPQMLVLNKYQSEKGNYLRVSIIVDRQGINVSFHQKMATTKSRHIFVYKETLAIISPVRAIGNKKRDTHVRYYRCLVFFVKDFFKKSKLGDTAKG